MGNNRRSGVVARLKNCCTPRSTMVIAKTIQSAMGPAEFHFHVDPENVAATWNSVNTAAFRVEPSQSMLASFLGPGISGTPLCFGKRKM